MVFKNIKLVSEDTIFDLDNDKYCSIMSERLAPKMSMKLDDLEILSGDSSNISSLWVDLMKDNFKDIVKDKVDFDTFLHSWIAGNRAVNASIPYKELDGKIGDMLFPHGLCLIGGLSMLGKSTFLRSLSEAWGVEYVVYGEPDFPCVTSRNELKHILEEFMLSQNRILIIDSISEFFLASGKSAAAAGGVNNKLLTDFPNLNNCLAMCGKTLIASINFGDKRERVEDLTTAYSGKVSMYVSWKEIGAGSFTNRVTRNRRNIEFSVITDKVKKREDKSVKVKYASGKNSLEFSDFTPLNFSITL